MVEPTAGVHHQGGQRAVWVLWHMTDILQVILSASLFMCEQQTPHDALQTK